MLLKLNIGNYVDKKTIFEADMVNNDVDDTKRGLLSSNNCCSCLEKCTDRCVLICCMCDESYHNKCVKRPVSDEFTTILNEYPSCWWICWNCTVTSPINYHNDSHSESRIYEYVDNSLADLRKTISKDFKSMLTSTLNDVMKPTPRLEGDVNLRKRDRDPTNTDVGSVFDNSLPKQRKKSNRIDLANGDNISSSSGSAPTISGEPSQVVIPTVSDHIPKRLSRQRRVTINDAEGGTPQDKFILHYRPISEHLALKTNDEWQNTRKDIGKILKSIKINFSNFNIKNGRVKLGFPSSECMIKAKEAIDSSSHTLWCYECYQPSLLLPKLTISNVPLDFDFPSVQDENIDFSCSDIREIAKSQILRSIIDKNDSIRSIVENKSAILEVVYIQK